VIESGEAEVCRPNILLKLRIGAMTPRPYGLTK
jgi:hypothetical protein